MGNQGVDAAWVVALHDGDCPEGMDAAEYGRMMKHRIARLTDREQGRATLRALVGEQIAGLREHLELVKVLEEHDRALAVGEARCAVDGEAAARHRYEMSQERSYHAALRQLRELKKMRLEEGEGDREPDEPVGTLTATGPGIGERDEPTTEEHRDEEGDEPTTVAQGDDLRDQSTSIAEGDELGDEPTRSVLGDDLRDEPTRESQVEDPGNDPTPEPRAEELRDEPTPETQGDQEGDEPTTVAQEGDPGNDPTPEGQAEELRDRPMPEPRGDKSGDEPTAQVPEDEEGDEPTATSRLVASGETAGRSSSRGDSPIRWRTKEFLRPARRCEGVGSGDLGAVARRPGRGGFRRSRGGLRRCPPRPSPQTGRERERSPPEPGPGPEWGSQRSDRGTLQMS